MHFCSTGLGQTSRGGRRCGGGVRAHLRGRSGQKDQHLLDVPVGMTFTCPINVSQTELVFFPRVESAPVPSSLPLWMASPPPPWPSGGPFTSPPPALCTHMYQDFSIHLPKPSASTLSLPFPLPGLSHSLSGPALSSKNITGVAHVILDFPVATL